MRIVFMGTPEFAVPSLSALCRNNHEVAAVVTAPDKPVGRGLKMKAPPVKAAALERSIPVLQPEDLEDEEFLKKLSEINSDLFVVVAFRILPQKIFELPPKGTINLHSSLLPKYRGAAPINWAIINGDKKTGVTSIFIRKEVDAGDIILQRSTDIGDDETAGELHDKLAILGATLLVETVDLIEKGDFSVEKQKGEITKAPKISKELGRINWNESGDHIRNLIRGLNPTPGAYSFLNGKLIKFYKAQFVPSTSKPQDPGRITSVNIREGILQVETGDGCLQMLELQPEGKRRMSACEFLRGNKLKVGDKFMQR